MECLCPVVYSMNIFISENYWGKNTVAHKEGENTMPKDGIKGLSFETC